MKASLLIASTLATITLLAAPAAAGQSHARDESHPAWLGSNDCLSCQEHDRDIKVAADRRIEFPFRPSGK